MRALSRTFGLSFAIMLCGASAWSVAVAGPSTGYRCGPGGRPDDTAGGCACPSGQVVSHDDDGTARCTAAPKPPRRRIDRDPDRDGIPTSRDRCPAAAEDPDGVEDQDGCPEAEAATEVEDALGACDADDPACSRGAAVEDAPDGAEAPRSEEPAVEDSCDGACAAAGARVASAVVPEDLQDAPERPLAGFTPMVEARAGRHDRGPTRRRKAALALGVASGGSLVGALALEVWARRIYDTDSLVFGTIQEDDAYRRANRRHLGAQAALGAGVALGVAAGYLWSGRRSDAAPKPVVTVDGRSLHLAFVGAF